MIDLESVTVEGFVSWGPYPTRLQLSGMEQCFILGSVADQAEGRSNGSGKSSLMQAIPWCLSGKTIYNQNPGDKILNWFSTGNARVVLRFKNGNELTRVRTRQGDTELLFRRGTEEVINCTLSTTGNQQRMLDNELKFDYDLFCGSVFFSQYRQPWLAMQDQSRKQAFERIMGIDRLSIYAEVAKAKADKAALEQEKLKASITSLEINIATLLRQLELMQTSSSSFESSRDNRRAAKLQEAVEYEKRAGQCAMVDLDRLRQKWAVVEKINTKITEIQTQINEADNDIARAENARLQQVMQLRDSAQDRKNKITQSIETERTKLRNKKEAAAKQINDNVSVNNQRTLVLRGKISEQNGIVNTQNAIITQWLAKAGKMCTECGRELPAEYANSKIDGPKNIKAEAEHKIEGLNNALKEIQNEVAEQVQKLQKLESATGSALTALSAQATEEIDEVDKQLKADILAATGLSTKAREDVQRRKVQLEQLITTTKNKLADAKPELTVNEATTKNAQRQTLLEAAYRATEDANHIAAEVNTHAASIVQFGIEIRTREEEIKTAKRALSTYDIILNHLQYIYKAYSDRRRIKSYLIGRHRPYFNGRLHHYLDLFGLDVKVSLTDALGIESNLWGYDFQSGGERGRTDLAFMFAVFDLHQGIHGPQSNLLILDEPEKALDEAGRQVLISIIKDDLAMRFESIFIISHSDCFRDVFPHQITVERTDRFSHITDIR